MTYADKAQTVLKIAKEGGALALDYFHRRGELEVESKQQQDFVSEADRNVETLIRAGLEASLPQDAIVGEEHAPKPGTSGMTWVIDPIDGTTNFLTGVPFWCVAIAGVAEGKTQVAVIYDALHDEAFLATRGGGATLNGAPMAVRDVPLTEGTICVGSSRRSPPADFAWLLQSIVEAGGVFARTGSGALGLAYVAAGRYLGYTESYMNAWDCLAGQLLIAEAGGLVEEQDDAAFIAAGGRVIAGAPQVFAPLRNMTLDAFFRDSGK
ncbi:Inositol-1-monophosphatase [Candidatus Rhodobacter oscarellae]|uniref:Inositol-1-monophosphatase n=1 Tax=Candidatus Rhodobacter oscarellae TaxID=1675527 RepID=A0A0J9E775_9RHOB|nr:inositol monophosphatase [Candidatus Rhodobacter lobularis]KMW58566.1 Inositol-1-monophosphatase [Candidatus Rhodobacter lobularis]